MLARENQRVYDHRWGICTDLAFSGQPGTGRAASTLSGLIYDKVVGGLTSASPVRRPLPGSVKESWCVPRRARALRRAPGKASSAGRSSEGYQRYGTCWAAGQSFAQEGRLCKIVLSALVLLPPRGAIDLLRTAYPS